jgi:hypothetical protein
VAADLRVFGVRLNEAEEMKDMRRREGVLERRGRVLFRGGNDVINFYCNLITSSLSLFSAFI